MSNDSCINGLYVDAQVINEFIFSLDSMLLPELELRSIFSFACFTFRLMPFESLGNSSMLHFNLHKVSLG